MAGERRVTLWIAASIALAACDKPAEPTPGAPPPAAPASAPSPGALPPGHPSTKDPFAPTVPASIVWDAPSGWEKVGNPSPMRIATYRIPKIEGDAEDAELSVSQAGGSLDANIDRWKGQFTNSPGEPIRDDRKVGTYEVTTVEISGTFASGMPGAETTPKDKFTMLAAIVKTGATNHFFKLTGPEKTVASAKADFQKMIDSIRDK